MHGTMHNMSTWKPKYEITITADCTRDTSSRLDKIRINRNNK